MGIFIATSSDTVNIKRILLSIALLLLHCCRFWCMNRVSHSSRIGHTWNCSYKGNSEVIIANHKADNRIPVINLVETYFMKFFWVYDIYDIMMMIPPLWFAQCLEMYWYIAFGIDWCRSERCLFLSSDTNSAFACFLEISFRLRCRHTYTLCSLATHFYWQFMLERFIQISLTTFWYPGKAVMRVVGPNNRLQHNCHT